MRTPPLSWNGPEGGGGDADVAALLRAADWQAAGRKVALATVIATWGSAPRAVGSHLVVREDGLFAGSVSGGCVEGDVVAAAVELLKRDERPRLLAFGVADETAWRVGLACGGRIRILIERLPASSPFAAEVPKAVARRRSAWRLVRLDDGQDAWAVADAPPTGALVDRLGAGRIAAAAGEATASGLLTLGGAECFLRLYEPARRLVIVGASHIAVYLARFAAQLGQIVEVIDPRGAFLDAFRAQLGALDSVSVVEDWPDEALAERPLDAHTALVTLTHDPKIDDVALAAARAGPAYYIGALGSRRTHAGRCARLKAQGWTDADLARIHAPVGLAIGAKGPAEIAVSILAELVAAARGRDRREAGGCGS